MTSARVDSNSLGIGGRDATDALIASARRGCSRSLGDLAQRYRRYLLLVAHESLSSTLRAKVGASDLVQETLLHFQERFTSFEGNSEEELLHWLRRILYYRALRVARKFGRTQARDLRREISLAALSGSGRDVAIADRAPTPCAELLADERATSLNAAILALPDVTRRVIRMRNVERLSFGEIGELLDCSPEAARKRWVRAIEQLRRHLIDDER